MRYLRIPIAPGNPAQDIALTLGGQSCVFALRWAARSGTWFLTVSISGSVVLAGKALVCGSDLFAQRRYDERLPYGALLVLDSQGAEDPTLDTLGARHQLYFAEPE